MVRCRLDGRKEPALDQGRWKRLPLEPLAVGAWVLLRGAPQRSAGAPQRGQSPSPGLRCPPALHRPSDPTLPFCLQRGGPWNCNVPPPRRARASLHLAFTTPTIRYTLPLLHSAFHQISSLNIPSLALHHHLTQPVIIYDPSTLRVHRVSCWNTPQEHIQQ